MITAYVLFGLLHISYEIENPFGYDINDLDLDRFCRGLAIDLDLITSYMPSPNPNDWLYSTENKPLWPLQPVVSFNQAGSMGLDTVKERLDDRRKRVMELWGRGLEKVEEERARKAYLRLKGESRSPATSQRSSASSIAETAV